MEVKGGGIPVFGKKTLCRSVALFVSLTLFTSTPALAAMRQFIPKYEGISANMGVRSLYEQSKAASNTSSRKRSSLDLIESLGIDGFGYIFSPLFISMKSSLGIGLEQQEFDNNGKKTSMFGDANTFRQEFKFLPAHPYNLEIYGSRSVPMTAGQAGDSPSIVLYNYGSRAVYELRPWAHTLTWTGNDNAGGRLNSQAESLNYTLLYFSDDTGAGGSYGHRKSSQNGRVDTTKTLYNLRLSQNLNDANFTSWWSLDELDENDIGQVASAQTFATHEEFSNSLDVKLPMRFTTNISYATTNDDETETTGDTRKVFFNNTERSGLRVHHRLFKSLNTSAATRYHEIHSNGGDSTLVSGDLATDHTKMLRWGMIQTGIWTGVAEIDNTGGARFLFERPVISASDILTLSYKTVDPTTIDVSVIDHNDNDRLVALLPGEYQIIPNTDPIQIRIISWPPANALAAPIGVNPHDGYAYRADYALIPAEYRIRTTSWGWHSQLPLFDNLIVPHYSYGASKMKEVEGDFPGNPGYSNTHALGLGFSKGNYNGDITQLWAKSDTNTEEKLSASVDYQRAITQFTRGFLSFSYEDGISRQTTGTGSAITEISETFYSAQSTLQASYPHNNLTASLTGSYSLYKGVGVSTTASLFSNLVWHIGETDLSLSASLSNSESEYGALTSTRQFTTIRMTLIRKLF